MSEAYEGWAIVEIMGHQSFAGLVRPEVQYGVEMLRVDVPEIPQSIKTERRNRSPYGFRMEDCEVEYPAMAAYTKWFGGASIYCLTPCTEEVARRAVESMRKAPVSAVYMPELEAEPKILTPMISAGDSDEPEERPTCACPDCLCNVEVDLAGEACTNCREHCHQG